MQFCRTLQEDIDQGSVIHILVVICNYSQKLCEATAVKISHKPIDIRSAQVSSADGLPVFLKRLDADAG